MRRLKLMVVGNGAREHALCWALRRSPRCGALLATRPTPGMAALARPVDLAADDVVGLAELAAREGVDLTIVGPEAPLVAGVADAFQARGLALWGPSAAAARLEGSKSFAKELLAARGVPTPPFAVFDDVAAARAYVRHRPGPVVVKADGLAAGKGSLVCGSRAEALAAVETLMVHRRFGAAGARVVIEERVLGREASLIALCDGARVVPLALSRDYKRAGEGGAGPNTGGMGAVSPPQGMPCAEAERLADALVRPVAQEMARRGTPFRGFLYAGLMLTDQGPQVLEINVRLGDPEAQVLLPRLQSDLVATLEAAAAGGLEDVTLRWDPRPAVCVVLASAGYPGDGPRGVPLPALSSRWEVGLAEGPAGGGAGAAGGPGEDVLVFQGGTALAGDSQVVTAGGRVLSVTAVGATHEAAAARAREEAERLAWPGAQWRGDIGR